MPENITSVKELHEQAAEAETGKDAIVAIQIYKQILAQDALNIAAYKSLMKLYRRGKDYKNELAIINKAIKTMKHTTAITSLGKVKKLTTSATS